MPGLNYDSMAGQFVGPQSGQIVDPFSPMNWDHPLNINRTGWWRVINTPGWRGSSVLHDLVRGGGKNPSDGTLAGSAALPIWNGSRGNFGQGCLSYGGTSTSLSSYVNCGSKKGTQDLALAATKGSSWAWWMKLASASSVGGIMERNDGNVSNLGWVIGLSFVSGTTFNIVFEVEYSSNSLFVAFSSVLAFSKWFRVVVSYDGTTTVAGVKCYVNGVSQTTLAFSQAATGTTASDSAQVMRLGNSSFSDGSSSLVTGSFSGLLDDLSVWKGRTLSAQDAALDYAVSRQGYPGLLNYLGTTEYSFPLAATTGIFEEDGVSVITQMRW